MQIIAQWLRQSFVYIVYKAKAVDNINTRNSISNCLQTICKMPAPVILRLVSSSVCIAQRAGKLIRDILKKGDLGIVEKASLTNKNFSQQLALVRE